MLARLLLGVVLSCCLLVRASRCAAEPVRELSFDMQRDLIVTGSLLGLNLLAEFPWPAPTRPRWTRVSAFDLRVALAVGAERPARIDRTSDALLGVALVGGSALALFGPWSSADQGRRRGFEDALITLQATLSAGLAAQVVKKIAARRRPAVHFDSTTQSELGRALGLRERQRFTSFYSGHASVTASILGALVSVSYLRGYAYRHAVAALFGLLTLATGTLRVVGQRHWSSDVIAGWAIGGSVGAGVPLLREALSKRRSARAGRRWLPTVSGGTELQLSWTF